MTLCNMKTDTKIRFSVYVAWRKGTLIQDVSFTVDEILAMQGPKVFKSK